MSTESETKKLLHFRQSLENRIDLLDQEIKDLKKAIQNIDKVIVSQGFKQPLPLIKPQEAKQIITKPDDGISITSKDGTILGKLKIEEKNLRFIPSLNFKFTENIPPFKSFLIDRVLENMKTTDKIRANNNEIDSDVILDFNIEITDEKIGNLFIENFGGERRLQEISSSLRWTFDKMYEKLRQG
jgi:hypothetical protein